jgi:hypothetical protein
MSRIIASIAGAIKREWTRDDVHFHAHADRPYACYDRGCLTARRDAG